MQQYIKITGSIVGDDGKNVTNDEFIDKFIEFVEANGWQAWCCYEQCEFEDDDDDYTPSATAGDYSPSNPWDAPGMSVHDFI